MPGEGDPVHGSCVGSGAWLRGRGCGATGAESSEVAKMSAEWLSSP